MKIKKKKIVFTGGGTAGHIMPIIAVLREIRRLGLKADFFYIGPKDEFGLMLLSQEGVKIKIVLAGKIRRYFSFKSVLQNIFDIFVKIPLGFLHSFLLILFIMPHLVFSKGGYGSLSAVLAGWFLRRKIILHESDIAPGLANRFLSRFSSRLFVSFPIPQTEYFSEEKMISVGNPIRRGILTGQEQEAKKLFDLTGEKPVLLILGGSQGAQKINDLILNLLPDILTEFELIHQTGDKNFQEVKAEAKVVMKKELEKYYHPIAFLQEIELRQAYKATSLAVSRAGSGTIFEIAACSKPAILIPLSISAQEHQVKNAYAYANNGGAIVIEEANLSPHFFLEKVRYLFSHPEELEEMSQKAKEFSKIESAKTVAQYVIDYLTKDK